MNLDAAVRLALLWYLDPQLQIADASPLPWLWMVAPEPYWAWEGQAQGPLLLEVGRVLDREATRTRRRGRYRNELREATVPVLLDSGAFTMISRNGCWTRTPKQHVKAAHRICTALGTVKHVATQDWMCEPDMLQKTGLTVEEHQRRTVASLLRCRDLAPELPWMPALQGYTVDDYLRCADLYDAAGVDLAGFPLVGLGSVCRRSGTRELENVIGTIARALLGVRLHGYGVKSEGTLLSCLNLRSVDSDAWSERGRWLERDIRTALGLPATARWPEVRDVMITFGESVDLDLVDRFEWMEAHDLGPRNLQNSQVWAETWRWNQQQRIAHEAMRRAGEVCASLAPMPRTSKKPTHPIYTVIENMQSLVVAGRSVKVWIFVHSHGPSPDGANRLYSFELRKGPLNLEDPEPLRVVASAPIFTTSEAAFQAARDDLVKPGVVLALTPPLHTLKPAPDFSVLDWVLAIVRNTSAALARLSFADQRHKGEEFDTLDPSAYAFDGYQQYLSRAANGRRPVLLLGMNPGTHGMAQVGIPFGCVDVARRLLGGDYVPENPPVLRDGLGYPIWTVDGTHHGTNEVSGRRLWAMLESVYGSLDAVLEGLVAFNYCPLVFVGPRGTNVSLQSLPGVSQRVEEICDRHLEELIDILEPRHIVAAGGFAAGAASRVMGRLSSPPQLHTIPHPSPMGVRGKAAEVAWARDAAAVIAPLR